METVDASSVDELMRIWCTSCATIDEEFGKYAGAHGISVKTIGECLTYGTNELFPCVMWAMNLYAFIWSGFNELRVTDVFIAGHPETRPVVPPPTAHYFRYLTKLAREGHPFHK